jgi:cytochrome oxidase Cu insertion factor (SCO1/SenC/PrrC family)
MTVSPQPILLMLALALLAAPNARAQEKGTSAPAPETGLKVGEMARGFTLKDQDGNERSLEEFLKKGKVALVFYRSADW